MSQDGNPGRQRLGRRTQGRPGRRTPSETAQAAPPGGLTDHRQARVPDADPGTVGRFRQLHERTKRDATRRQYEQALRLHILPVLGGRPLGTIRRSNVQSLVNAWAAEGASANSVANSYFKALRLVFKNAVLDGLAAKSPCVGIRRPEVVAKQIVPLTVEQILAIAEEIEPRCRAGVLLGAGGGRRVGEISGLLEPGIRWMARQIAVTRQMLRAIRELLRRLTTPGRRACRSPGSAPR